MKEDSLIYEMNSISLPDNSISIWYLGQSGFAVKYDNTIAYFDPYLSNYLELFTKGRPDADPRHFQPPISENDITNADIFFGSHWHYDHIDPKVVTAISNYSPKCKFIVPRHARKFVIDYGANPDNIICPEVHKTFQLDTIEITALPSAHETLEQTEDYGYPYLGYIVKMGDITIYHSGDCIPYQGLVESLCQHKIDIALLPINGRDFFRLERGFAGNFTFQEVAELSWKVGVDLLIPCHYGMHMANTERIGSLTDFLAEKFPKQRYHVMVPGKNIIYMNLSNKSHISFTKHS